ncbi:MAG TPA: endolytic transglycosylase MltG [Candidatus Limnocylindria bacterium]|nr:endolytic transglycosylase MltG [Candidatus Limnocylindria bacterium]
MTEPVYRGPVRAPAARRGRPTRPPQRSSAGPLVFALVVVVAAVALFFLARPLATDAIAQAADDHDTLLRQAAVRAVIAPTVEPLLDVPADPNGKPVDFTVRRGATAAQIAADLQSAGLIKSALAFKFVLYQTGTESALQTGTYKVSPALSPRDIAALFQRAPGDQVALRVIEGWRLTEVAAAVSKALPAISAKDFTAAAVVGTRNNFVLTGLDPTTSLEGFLFPDTYLLRPDATADQIVGILLDTFEIKAGPALRTASAERKASIYDMVKLASIVEREARDRKESPTIAGVYQHRLDIGMKLDADPTIQYAKGTWDELSLDDLKLDSPYNTYRNPGLPPTPIANPGLVALQAATKPEPTDFLFFVAKGDGTGDHAFAKTIEEQEANRVKYGNK